MRAYAEADSFLESPPAADFAGSAETQQPISEAAGTKIGPYKLLQQIGEGGFGVVYMAEQLQPVRRKVALKIIKPGMDTREVIARFESERQALALMDHPNIAKVLDAGATESGRPYFVMELVKGIPITQFCDDNHLPPDERLELFIQVCNALQHAHQKGIIHRDLKPSNVMVTMRDGCPVPKVIDFGVAKATSQTLTERTLFTAYGQMIGTPAYMSPEQAEMSCLDIDTRSDIYSLGVLLYELLTGTTPFEAKRLREAGFAEMQRIIREEEPESVSTRISKMQSGKPGVVAGVNRRAHAALRELDWIVMKSLDKDRECRYESAISLARDIRRYLSDEPVQACPPTARYRFRKFARKHKPALATAGAIAACLILGITISAWQAARATQAEAQANANAIQAQASSQEAKEKAQEATVQRDEAQRQRDVVKALADRLQRTLYASRMNLAQRAWDSGAIGRVNELLEQSRPKPGDTDLRGFEWHYLYKQCHPELLMFQGSAVAFSPDGKRLAIGTTDSLKILDAQTNRELISINARARSAAFSPDSKRLATATREDANQRAGSVKVWDAETGQELHEFKGLSIVFSHDGNRLATTVRDDANEGAATVKVWDVPTGQELLSVKGWTVAFSPDGKRLATAGEEAVKVWDAQTGQELLSLKATANGNVAYSPEGKRLASGSDDEVKVWDANSGEELPSLKGHNQQVDAVAFSPDGKRLASGSYDKTVRVWDVQTGNELFSFKGHTSEIKTVAFNHDGTRLASRSADGIVRIWDASSKQEPPPFSGAAATATSVSFSSDGRRVCSAISDPMTEENVIKLWDAQTRQELLSIKKPPGNRSLRVVTISPDGKRVAAGYGKDYDETEGRFVSGDVWVWDAQSGLELVTLNGHTWAVVGLAFSPDSNRLVSCASNPNGWGSDQGKPCEVKLWDVTSGQELMALAGHNSFVESVAYSPSGNRLATLSRDNTLKLRDAQTGQELLCLPVQVTGVCSSVAFSPDGTRLASSNNPHPHFSTSQLGQIKVWDAQTGKELLTLQGHTIRVKKLVFSPDGKRLASTSGPGDWHTLELKLWDAESGDELLTFEKQNVGENQILGGRGFAFSPNGHHLVTAGSNGRKILDATPLPEPTETKP